MTNQKTTIERFTSFVKSPSAPVFALATMMISFFFLYGKMYYQVIPDKYRMFWAVDVLTAVIVGGGLSTITFIVLVHNQKKGTAIFFAVFDAIGGLLFYDVTLEKLISLDLLALQGVFFALIKAGVLLKCADIFIEEVRAKEQSNEQTNSEIQTLQERIDTLLKESIAKEKALQNANLENSDLKNAIASLNSDIKAKDSELLSKVSSLETSLKMANSKYKSLESEAKVWRLGFLEKLAGDTRKRSKTPENIALIEEYENEIKQLEKELNY